jgi:hypothetical protein
MASPCWNWGGRLDIRIDTEKLRPPHAPLRVEFYDTRAFMLVFASWVAAFAFLPLWPALGATGTVTAGYILFGPESLITPGRCRSDIGRCRPA